MLIWVAFALVTAGETRRSGVSVGVHRDVVTTQGTVRGYLSDNSYSYLGVPYARPPTSDRFKAPEPPPSWDGIFEATHRVRCPQLGSGSVNCLVVNVFTPEHGTSLPVLVYVHGGGFQTGWGPHHPPLRLLREGIVVVTFNYRLGIRGFLCLNTPETANAGLKDQVTALYWIQRNIANFGGNPNAVTLYGTEAGAAAIQMLLLSGVTEGLFHKVILESGSVLSPSYMTYNPSGVAMETARKLGYNDEEDARKLLKFYQLVKDQDLSTVTNIYLPCVENESDYSTSLLNSDPKVLLMQGNFQKVPMLITYPNKDYPINADTFDTVLENFDQLLPHNLEFESNKTRHRVAELVKEFYFENDYENVGEQFSKYAHDVITEYPIIKSAFLHVVNNYFLVFLMRFDNGISVHDKNPSPSLKNIFDYICSNNNMDDSAIKSNEILLTLWTNFIKLGDPTPITTELIPVIWEPALTEETDRRIDIDNLKELALGTSIKMTEPISSQYVLFWDRIYDKFYKPYTNNNNNS